MNLWQLTFRARFFWVGLILFFAHFICPPQALAADYYVDTQSLGGSCSDSNPGSLAEPFCTAAQATAVAEAGDTVYFRAGTYHETLTPINSGSAESRIYYTAYQDETPIFSGADALTGWVSLGDQESGGSFVTGFESGNLDDFDSITTYEGSTSETGGLFAEGFEDNTLGNFNSTTVEGTNTALIQTDLFRHGTRAVELTYDGTNENNRLNKNLTTSDDVTVRFYFQVDESFDLVGTNQTHDLVRLRLSTTGNRVKAGIRKDGSGNLSIVSQIETPSSSTLYAGTPGEITRGEWHMLELRYKGGDASTGGAELWLDGHSLASNYALNTSGLQVSRVELGGNSSGATQPTLGSTIVIDSIKVDTVGPIGEFEVENTDNTVELTSSQVHNGAATLINTYGGAGQNARVNKNISSTTDAYGRVYFRFNSDFSLVQPDEPHTFFILREGTSGNRVKANIERNAGGQLFLTATLEAPSEQVIYGGSPGELVADTWYAVELRYKGGDAITGGAEVWLNGTSLGSNYSLDTSGFAVNRIEVGGNATGNTFPTAGSEMYFDDLKSDSVYIGEFVPEGDANIFKVGGINWTPTDVYQDLDRLEEVESLLDLEDPGQWFADTDTDFLYVHSSTSSDPDDYTMDVTRRSRVIEINNLDYITVQNLTVQHSRQTGEAGVYIADSDSIEILENTIRQNTGSGVRLISTTNSLIAQNVFSENLREFGGGIRLEQGSDNNTLRSNTISGTGLGGGNGIFLCGDVVCNSQGNSENIIERNVISNVHDSCLYLDLDNDSNVVRQNFCSGSARRSESSGGNGIHIALGSDFNTVFSNIVAGVERHGISVRAGNESQGFIANVGTQIVNNTVYQSGTLSGNGINIQAGNDQTVVKNNIVHTAAGAAINIDPESVGEVDANYNLYYNPGKNIASWNSQIFSTLGSYQQASLLESRSFSSDPRFKNPTDDDFALSLESPAINSGEYLAELHSSGVDYSASSRVLGPAVDLGALESASWLTPSQTSSSNENTTSLPSSQECQATPPTKVPQLFELRARNTTIQLSFVPAGSPITSYMVIYRDMSTGVEYAVVFPSTGQSSGVEQHTISSLRPATRYMLRVQGMHHCAASGWSNELEVTTTRTANQENVQYLVGRIERVLRNVSLRFESFVAREPVSSADKSESAFPTLQNAPTSSPYPESIQIETSETSTPLWRKLLQRLRSIFQ